MPVPSPDTMQGAAPTPPNRRLPTVAFSLALVAVGLIGGFGAVKLADDPHTAKPELLVGTVTWSNDETRSIAFEEDGALRGPSDGDTIYSVIAESWQDAGGTLHHDGTYPTCLVGEENKPVSVDRHRVELEVLHRDTGAKAQHIAVHVHCLD
ncbi:hypothetical protein NIE79_003804 [Micromonospora sp. NIE79]|uniref:Uncharacterized protein n=1 Tax=Micromonospora trifolii TaxID=2911208 RepID=A0ABS9N5X1_9ACTN|nr:hypothetical protein [Micromonospora trifolii]MCG5445354.1 hypothetical protein [Micromonospora trifolii]